MNIDLEKVIVHTVNPTNGDALISEVLLSTTEATQQYLSKLAQRVFESDEAKSAELSRESELEPMLSDIDNSFIKHTQALASEWNRVATENPEIPAADIVFMLINIEGTQAFGALKLPRKNGYIHVYNNGESRLEQIEGVLPSSAGKPDEAFFIRVNDKALKVIEKRYEIDGRKATYLASRILGCKIGHSPKQALDAICKAAVEVNQQFYGSLGVDEPAVAAAVVEEYRAAPTELSAERVCQRLYKDLPHAREAFSKALSEQEIPFDIPVEISAPAVRRLEKQSLRSGSGVEVRVPVSVYKNPEALEFLKNDDGTTSLLIKNILL